MIQFIPVTGTTPKESAFNITTPWWNELFTVSEVYFDVLWLDIVTFCEVFGYKVTHDFKIHIDINQDIPF